jgi:hypothetical protein
MKKYFFKIMLCSTIISISSFQGSLDNLAWALQSLDVTTDSDTSLNRVRKIAVLQLKEMVKDLKEEDIKVIIALPQTSPDILFQQVINENVIPILGSKFLSLQDTKLKAIMTIFLEGSTKEELERWKRSKEEYEAIGEALQAGKATSDVELYLYKTPVGGGLSDLDKLALKKEQENWKWSKEKYEAIGKALQAGKATSNVELYLYKTPVGGGLSDLDKLALKKEQEVWKSYKERYEAIGEVLKAGKATSDVDWYLYKTPVGDDLNDLDKLALKKEQEKKLQELSYKLSFINAIKKAFKIDVQTPSQLLPEVSPENIPENLLKSFNAVKSSFLASFKNLIDLIKEDDIKNIIDGFARSDIDLEVLVSKIIVLGIVDKVKSFKDDDLKKLFKGFAQDYIKKIQQERAIINDPSALKEDKAVAKARLQKLDEITTIAQDYLK